MKENLLQVILKIHFLKRIFTHSRVDNNSPYDEEFWNIIDNNFKYLYIHGAYFVWRSPMEELIEYFASLKKDSTRKELIAYQKAIDALPKT